MSRAVANAVRVATFVVFAAVAVLAYRTFNPPPAESVPTPRAGEVPVDQAISIATDRPLVVRGTVFDGPGGLGLRLCRGKRNTSPPRCIGPFLDLHGVDEGSFPLESASSEDGEVRWMDEPVALRGSILGTRMDVSEILR
jgi:hypothetical protein